MHEPDNTLAVSVTVDLARDRDAMRASIIEAIANKVLYGVSYDEDGDPCSVPTKISSDLRNAMHKAINAEVEKHVGPAVEEGRVPRQLRALRERRLGDHPQRGSAGACEGSEGRRRG
jgi:hypothetical protein